MAMYFIENEEIRIGVNHRGAELVSLVRKSDKQEYMWTGDKEYWNRVSPVLFPFVGKCKDQSYRYQGKEYKNIPQHGFARDSEFTMVEQNEDELWFELTPDSHWKENYPFDFCLRIGYRLEGKKVHVMWTVRNDGQEEMHFSIGAHPAFRCFDQDEAEDVLEGYQLDLHTNRKIIRSGELNEDGTLKQKYREFPLKKGCLLLSAKVFEKDALVLDSSEIHTVSMINPEGKAFLQLHFDTPQLGLWSPAGKNAPFVCIEPWFGRCDREDFKGSLEEREYANRLKAGHSFSKEYVIEVL